MAFSDFTLESVQSILGVTTQQGELFPSLQAMEVPAWLRETLALRTPLALISEKARSEFIVVPILLSCRALHADRLALFSGQRLDVDPEKGLIGECDFILSLGPSVPPLRAPIITIVEAKKNDIEMGLAQCIAQMIAARQLNEQAGLKGLRLHGCVTTGEVWQFLRLEGSTAVIDGERFYLGNVGSILAALQSIVAASC